MTQSVHSVENGAATWLELDSAEQEHIPGVDPDTGKRDGRYDGRITASVPIELRGKVDPVSDPRRPQLVEAVRSTELLIAPDLGTGLASLATKERRGRIEAGALRRYDPRSR